MAAYIQDVTGGLKDDQGPANALVVLLVAIVRNREVIQKEPTEPLNRGRQMM